jgi:hypothetical protein
MKKWAALDAARQLEEYSRGLSSVHEFKKAVPPMAYGKNS